MSDISANAFTDAGLVLYVGLCPLIPMPLDRKGLRITSDMDYPAVEFCSSGT